MRSWLLIFTLCSVLLACSSNGKVADSSQHENWETLDLKYAEHFKLQRQNNNFSLILLDPDSKKEVQRIAINSNTNHRIICLTATLTGMFCELEARNQLIGVTAENQLYDKQLKALFQQGKLSAYGDFEQLALERVVNASPDFILYNYVNNEFPHAEKLKKLGIKLLVVNDWLEAHPLAKAEWIKVVGAVSGKYDEACQLFNAIERRYNETRVRVSKMTASPSVISGNLVAGSWYAPSGENYYGILINDAGGNYVYKETTGAQSLKLSLEKILEDNVSTEIWLNPGVSNKRQLLQLNPHANLLSAFQNNTYCYSSQMNKFWEQSALRADFVLEDLAHIFHPELDSSYAFHYYASVQ